MVEHHLVLKFPVGPNRNAPFQGTPFLYDHDLVLSSLVLVYPYNSQCCRLGEMHCKASNGKSSESKFCARSAHFIS